MQIDVSKIDAIFADLDRGNAPGVAVGIAVHGRPVYRKAFGLANLELPLLLSTNTRMRIGSTSKHFTSLAYVLLCEAGLAGIDDPIGKHLPELHPASRAVTARQLMGNIGGLRDVHDISWQFSGTGRAISSAELLALYRDIDDVNAPAGTAWIYNNGGFLMLSAAIERITGRTLEEVLTERIFDPVGMYDTMLRRTDADFVPNSAALHMTLPSFDAARPAQLATSFDKASIGTLAGEGGIVSTVDDMLRWLAHMERPTVGTAETWKLMRSPQRLANGTATGYGFGLMIGQYRGVDIVCHPGGVMGGNSQMLKVPCAGLDIAIMTNRADVMAMLLTNQILDTCLAGLTEDRAERRTPLLSGIYRSAATGRVIQLFGKGSQQIASIDGLDIPVDTDADGKLRPAGVWHLENWTVAAQGVCSSPEGIRFDYFGIPDELIRESDIEGVDARAIIGRYQSKQTSTEAVIAPQGDRLRLQTAGRFGSVEFDLVGLARDIWRARSLDRMPWGGVLVFDPDRKGFRFRSSRTWGLPFRRVD